MAAGGDAVAPRGANSLRMETEGLEIEQEAAGGVQGFAKLIALAAKRGSGAAASEKGKGVPEWASADKAVCAQEERERRELHICPLYTLETHRFPSPFCFL